MNLEKEKFTNIFRREAVLAALFIGLSIVPTFALASPITKENVLSAINQERTSKGLSPLRIDSDLDRAAQLKSRDMINRNYFEHYAFGLTPWTFMLNAGYNYLDAGENLAMDFNTTEGMVKAWMDSPAHRDNILSSDYNDIGLGVVKGVYIENGVKHETNMVTNMFGVRKPVLQVLIDRIKNIFPF